MANPKATADPPIMRASLLRKLVRFGTDESSLRSSTAKRRPPRIPLLRNVVANPNHIPAATRLTSCPIFRLSVRTPLAKKRWAKNERNAKTLSL